MELVQQHDIDIMGISEAILHSGNADFTMSNSQMHKIFWAMTENDRNSRTGILIKKPWDKHVTNNLNMRVEFWHSHFNLESVYLSE